MDFGGRLMKLSMMAKLTIGMLLGVLLVCGIVGLSLYAGASKKSEGLLINIAGRQRMLTQKITKATLGYASELRAASIAHDLRGQVADDYRREAVDARNLFASSLESILDGGEVSIGDWSGVAPRCADPEIRTQLELVQRLWTPFAKSVNRVLDATSVDADFIRDVDQISETNLPLLKEMNVAVAMFQARSEAQFAAAQRFKKASLGVLVLACGFAYLMVRRQVIRPLSVVIGELDRGSEEVKSSSDQLAAIASQLADSAQTQSQCVQATSDTMDDLLQHVDEGAKTSTEATELAIAAREEAVAAGQTINEFTDAMSSINRSAGEIGRIINVIEEIAFQTNLLALNAAVEAARAGEHGRGFAVVAEEVRNLAMRAAEAARETNDLIGESVSRANSGSAVAGQAADAFGSIGDKVSGVSDMLQGLQKTADSHVESVGMIRHEMDRLNTMTQSNAASAEESAAAAEEMSTISVALKDQLVANLSGVVHGTLRSEAREFDVRRTTMRSDRGPDTEVVTLNRSESGGAFLSPVPVEPGTRVRLPDADGRQRMGVAIYCKQRGDSYYIGAKLT